LRKIPKKDSDKRSDVCHPNERWCEVIRGACQDKCGSSVENIEPHEIGSILKAAPKNDRESQ
jgi:hypothetical protein